jgi:AbrB family looped-hinge helix DNA binding protein
MPAVLEVEATVTSKGQITLPAALRAKLGLSVRILVF